MPLFMDRHEGLAGVTPRDVAEAHIADLEVQGRYGVRYLNYWMDLERGQVFCLADAPNAAAAEQVHREAHGLVAAKIIEVDQRMVQAFLGSLDGPAPGELWVEPAFRVVAFTDIEGSTRLTQELGDDLAMELLREHDRIVREHLDATGGQEVKHTGDGIMASFTSVSRGVRWAADVQRGFEARNGTTQPPLRVRIGMSAGEPVAEGDDLFGATVQLAARLCGEARAGAVLVAGAVRDLALGKGFRFKAHDPVPLKGFPEPVTPYELIWRN
ncbi:MAG TPA: nickel-binding protein [Nitriliruptorales bacterium]|nr:nickel-binding protein [Nitriliruptorales bacterium]